MAVATPITRTSERMLRSIPEDSLPHNTESFKGQDIKRTDTPETLLTEFSNRPDISIYCDRCAVYVDIRNLPYHRSYHEALLTLNYRYMQKPYDVRTLLQRRNIVLKKMKADTSAENPLKPKDIQKVNDAFELLKSDLEDSYEEMKQVHEKIDFDVRGVSLNCSPACAYAVGMCSSENNRWKNHMEDVKVYQDYFGEDRNKCYLAVFDGHHGSSSAERSACEMHHLLLHEMAKFDSKTKSTTARNFAESATARTDYELLRPETRDSFRVNLHQDSADIVKSIMDVCNSKYDEMMKGKTEETEAKKKKSYKHPFSDKMQKAFKKTYHLMDILLSYGKDENSKVRWSGTSALNVVIQSTKGDSSGDKGESKLDILEEELSGSGSPRRASKTVDPPVELGMIHIANAGSSRALLVRDCKAYRLTKDHTPNNFKERERIVAYGGTLSTSDRDCRVNGVLSVTRSLGNHGDKKLKDCVIVDPHVTSVPIDQYAQFLVLASSGVWSVLSDEEVTSLLVKLLPSEQIPPPSRFSESLMPLFTREPVQSKSVSVKSMSDVHEQQREEQHRQSPTKAVTFSKESTAIDDLPAENTSDEVNSPSKADVVNSNDGKDESEMKEQKDEADSILEENHDKADVLVLSDNDESDNKATRLVLADMQTEVGSHISEGGQDASLHLGDNHGRQDQYVSVEEHSNIPPPAPLTVEERRCEMAGAMAEYLTQAALLAGSRNNITVMVVLLPGCGID